MRKKELLYADIETSVINWIFNSSGWNKEDLAKKLKIKIDLLDKWFIGELKPTIKQLEDLSIILKRPLAVFFLSEPSKEPTLPKDYRMLPDRTNKFDKKTLLAIRRSRRLQEISRELFDNLNTSMDPKINNLEISNSSKQAGESYRKELNFNEEKQKKIKNPYKLFNYLRELIEDRNIFVFQISMPLDDARGFALIDGYPALIVVNSKDTIEARIFTLLHEFGHIILNEPGISMPENSLILNTNNVVEKWCNEFASALIFPESLAKNVFSANQEKLTNTKTLEKLSKTYKVSKAMLLYNMHKYNFISTPLYNEILERYSPDKVVTIIKEGKKKRFGGSTAEQRCINERGERFVSLVANNIERGLITHSDALSYLSIKLKNLDKVIGKSKK